MAADQEPSEPVLDSAMATGSDEGAPGDHSDGAPPDLDSGDAAEAVEDTPEAASAAHDDAVLPPSVLPSAADGGEDPLTPRFREPGEA
ncbi:hypothetical protein CLV92_10253 [Kineococcus xinjiangensis]|uniref:Uncharacterized protein n=1 Tax=Kineococcus xinjiangensis TaxID=512762 RepID=A0A2S6IUS2_9ACTN|nr:hypothetical protein [Kineococcus xinjiangensis]PPK97903.1 hypothetical protein CLV92_10253 [Kineococcus xinjiangensis]